MARYQNCSYLQPYPVEHSKFQLYSQALLAADQKAKKWSCPKTMRSIINKKKHWFRKNVMSTVQILPALIGAVPFDISTLECPQKGDC